jgi:hypothetical protein
MDAPPTNGNILVAFVANCVSTANLNIAGGWTLLNIITATPDNLVAWRVAGSSESATQSPVTNNVGGCLAIVEISGGTVARGPNSGAAATATAVNVPFTDDDEFLPTSTGLGLGFAIGYTTGTISWNGVFSNLVQGNFAAVDVGGVNAGSIAIGSFTKTLNDAPAGGFTVPSSSVIAVSFALVA